MGPMVPLDGLSREGLIFGFTSYRIMRMSEASESPVYFMGGMNGVGKTTVLEGIRKSDQPIRMVKGSTAFMEWLGVAPGDYATLQSMPDEVKNTEANRMFASLIQQRDRREGGLVLDTHYLLIKEGEARNLGLDWLHMVSAFVLVTARAEDVYGRIRADEIRDGRDRRKLFEPGRSEAQKLEDVARYLAATQSEAEKYSATYGKPLLVLENNQGQLDQTVSNFLSFHRRMTEALERGFI